MNKKSIIIFLLLVLLIPVAKVNAITINDYKKELSDLLKEKEYVQKNQAEIQKKIDEANAEILKISEKMILAEQEKTAISQQITKNELDIAEKKEQIKDLIVFSQKSSSDNFYLNYLFGAENFTDFIYRISIIQQLTKKNSELMDQMNKLIEDGKTKQEELEETKKSLNKMSEDYKSKVTSLGTQMNKTYTEYEDIDEQIKSVRKTIKLYQDQGCKDDQDIIACVGKILHDTGFIIPTASGTVTDEYGPRPILCANCSSFHKGIDLAASEGTKVYAAASGYVAAVKYANKNIKNDCGGNIITINHIVNGKYYTTRYWHLLNVKVKAGDTVTKGQLIGWVGGYTTSSQLFSSGYDDCAFGAHLHFEISKDHYYGITNDGHSYSSYTKYVKNTFNARNVINFPGRW